MSNKEIINQESISTDSKKPPYDYTTYNKGYTTRSKR